MKETLRRQFQAYTKKFLSDDALLNRNVTLKISHCLRVAEICSDIASHEGFSHSDITIAYAAGLLHDIGRFEQYKRFQTFADNKSINHGVLGAEILSSSFDFSSLSDDDNTLLMATTRFHNCACVPDDQDPRILMMLRLVRDADKIDIFDLSYEYFSQRTESNKNETLELHVSEEDAISDRIYARIMSGQLAMMSDIRTLNDFKALQLSWIFDVNYRRAFDIITERRSIEKLYATFPRHHARADDIYQQAKTFLDRRLLSVL